MTTTADTSLIVNGNDLIDQFREAMANLADNLAKAGTIVLAAIDDDPDTFESLKLAFPTISSVIWRDLEKIGRKVIHPALLISSPCIDSRTTTLVKNLPYSLQERIIARERFPLLLANGDTLLVDISECTREQAEQLIDHNTLRTISAQKAYMATQDRQPEVSTDNVVKIPYVISRGEVKFTAGCILKKPGVIGILAQM